MVKVSQVSDQDTTTDLLWSTLKKQILSQGYTLDSITLNILFLGRSMIIILTIS